MLTVSPTAAEAITKLVESASAPDTAGIRIAAGQPTEQGTPLSLSLVDGPQPDDEVVQERDAAVFLEPQVAPYLADAMLDAQVSDGEVAFALRDDAGAPPPSPNGTQPD